MSAEELIQEWWWEDGSDQLGDALLNEDGTPLLNETGQELENES